MNKIIKVINKSGKELDFEAALEYMDDEIREELHSKLAPCEEQEFFTAYEESHEKKFDEPWFLSESNPNW